MRSDKTVLMLQAITMTQVILVNFNTHAGDSSRFEKTVNLFQWMI